jgi:hypothetical protein
MVLRYNAFETDDINTQRFIENFAQKKAQWQYAKASLLNRNWNEVCCAYSSYRTSFVADVLETKLLLGSC